MPPSAAATSCGGVNAQIFGAVPQRSPGTPAADTSANRMATFYDYRPDEALEADKRPALPADRDADADDSDPAEPDKDDEPTQRQRRIRNTRQPSSRCHTHITVLPAPRPSVLLDLPQRKGVPKSSDLGARLDSHGYSPLPPPWRLA